MGCVSPNEGGLIGWAWHPADPSVPPVLTIRPIKGSRKITITASDTDVRIDSGGLLARPRGFAVSAAALAKHSGALQVLGRDGRDLLGSPLVPSSHLPAARLPVATVIPRSDTASRQRPPVDVVVPVYGGGGCTLSCLDSVLVSLPQRSRLVVVDDASREPELVAALNALAQSGRITLLRHRKNRGYTASANAGIKAVAGRDVVLLNSDTLVAPGWLQELRRVVYGAPDIGTATPLSNDATILSYPDRTGNNKLPDLAETIQIDTLARRTNGGEAIDIPVGVGFCMYIRRACLEAVGRLRADLFAQGYGEGRTTSACVRGTLGGGTSQPRVYSWRMSAPIRSRRRRAICSRETRRCWNGYIPATPD